jgi:hypothetical protein
MRMAGNAAGGHFVPKAAMIATPAGSVMGLPSVYRGSGNCRCSALQVASLRDRFSIGPAKADIHFVDATILSVRALMTMKRENVE